MTKINDSSKITYMQLAKELVTAHNKFIEKNVKVKGNGMFTIKSDEAVEVFIIFKSFIHEAVLLYDMVGNKISKDDKIFMSGIKHLDNTFKHANLNIDIYDLFRTVPSMGARSGGDGTLKTFCGVKFILQDIPVGCDEKFINQRFNYDNNIKGKDLIEITKTIDKILHMYIK